VAMMGQRVFGFRIIKLTENESKLYELWIGKLWTFSQDCEYGMENS